MLESDLSRHFDCIIGGNEYCQWETFNATCTGANETISITSARYGRMRVGRCAPNYYMIGCVADVSDLVKSRCDAKTSCAISLPDRELAARDPCRKDVNAYLEVDYQCVPGETKQSLRYIANSRCLRRI